MSVKMAILLIVLSVVYITVFIVYVSRYLNSQKHKSIMEEIDQKDEFKTFNYEDFMLKKLHFDANKSMKYLVPFLIIERILLIIAVIVTLYMLRGLGMALVGSLFVSFIFADLYEKEVQKSGIMNIGKINNFINFFVPHITSGNSADQSFLEYMTYSNDEGLKEWFENQENKDYHPPKYVRQILDIFDIAKYNEEKGINNYTGTLNEISKDYEQKQTYYNSFIGGIGEIRPTEWSYYIGVPFLIAISYSQTKTFWEGIGGIFLSIALLVIFTIFKFLIYKLKKDTINTIF